MNAEEFFTVPELAKELGITPRAIRFYETKSLLSPQRAGNTRIYTHRDKARLILILRGKRLGFSLAEIKEFLDLYIVDTSQTEQLKHLVQMAREKIRNLEEQRIELDKVLSELRDIEKVSVDTLKSKGITL